VAGGRTAVAQSCDKNTQVEICVDEAPPIYLPWWTEHYYLPPESLWKISEIVEEILNKHGLKSNDPETQASHRDAFPLKAGEDPITDEVLKEHGLKLGRLDGKDYFNIFVPIGPGTNPTMDEVLKKLKKQGLELDSTRASAPIGPGLL
jgi:hypothetical protein